MRVSPKEIPVKALMKTTIVVWLVFCSSILGASATGFVQLYTFASGQYGPSTNANGSGINPVIISDGVLYGTAAKGGPFGNGTVFRINADGTGFTNLYSFTATSKVTTPRTNADGASPNGGLVLVGKTLYGITGLGGTGAGGTIFKINTDGTGFTNMYNFSPTTANTNSDGFRPYGALTEAEGTLYGTTELGGNAGNGTIFRINTNGTGFASIYGFSPNQSLGTNDDGSLPLVGLVLSGNRLFGTAYFGGHADHGTVFSLNTDGTAFTTLHHFSSLDGYGFNLDGAEPRSRLILSGSTLYGTTTIGGASGNGVLFSVETNGAGFTTLYSFTGLGGSTIRTNSDGARPRCGLVQSGSLLFGTTENGGAGGSGTVFLIGRDGSGFTNLYAFSTGSLPDALGFSTNVDGVNPCPSLTLSGNTVFGATFTGGAGAAGVIFALQGIPSGAIPLQIAPGGNSVVLTWADPMFFLQSAPSAGGTFTNVPGAVSPYTNTIVEPQRVFRLYWPSQP